MIRISLCLFVFLSWNAGVFGQAAVAPDATLKNYVEREDTSYIWKVKKESQLGKTKYAELIMTSQTWRDMKWRHQLFILMPKSVPADNRTALLMIAGGSWRDKLADPKNETKLPTEATIFAATAEKLQMPVAVLLQVPNQPLFGDLYEDEIISHTFAQYMKTKDPDWPLLLPMVKSAVRSMDTIQAFLKSKGDQPPVEEFVVTGASKRGWTTWLSAVADKRVTAIAPMVIDVLDMPRQMEYMAECWGAQSDQISDYTEKGLHDAFKTETGKKLNRIVDPYSYRQQLTLPKLLLLGTNDAYWPVDAMNIYWDGLKGEKHVLYVPNAGHGLEDISRVLGGLVNFSRLSAKGKTFPKLDWKHSNDDDKLKLSVTSSESAEKAALWVATSDDRDFRDAKWKSYKATGSEGAWSAETDSPETGYKAIFGELTYPGDGMKYQLSTAIKVYKADK